MIIPAMVMARIGIVVVVMSMMMAGMNRRNAILGMIVVRREVAAADRMKFCCLPLHGRAFAG
jgi:hypothetical protein